MWCFKINLFVVWFCLLLTHIKGQRRSCTTPNGETSQCVPIRACSVLYNAITTQDRQQLKFLKESQCGIGRQPLVCCGSYDNYRSQNSYENLYGDDSFGSWGSNRRRNPGLNRDDSDDRPSWGSTDRRTNNGWSTTDSNDDERSTWGGNNNRRTNNGWGTTNSNDDERSTWGGNNNRRTNNGFGITNKRTDSDESDWDTEDGTSRNTNRRTESTNRNQGSGNKLPDKSTCGFQDGDRILDGQVTSLTEFPWMALLQYRKKNGDLVFSCGGTLISSRYVLTAAHCVQGQITTKIGPLVNVRLGEYNTDTEKDCSNNLGFQICNDKPVDSDIEKVTVHPNYSDTSADRYNDIALIKLKREVPKTDFIRPICLPNSSERSAIGEKLVVAGWGRTEYASSSSVKLKLWVPVAEKSKCSTKFRSAGVNLGDKQLCAGGERGRDSCNGDSGGPLMKARRDTSQWYIEGIVSFGARCGSEGWPGIYTRVGDYVDWIQRNVV